MSPVDPVETNDAYYYSDVECHTECLGFSSLERTSLIASTPFMLSAYVADSCKTLKGDNERIAAWIHTGPQQRG